MPVLDWIGKSAVVRHHRDVPYRLLEPVASLSCGDADSGNLIVQGDNLHALKALLPRYAGRVKCIYIDPPYNTGNEGWAYNDNVNSPEIRKWLGEVVGKEGETLDRHDRWLCMMYPRLVLLKQLLRDDGVIFISIDEFEIGALELLMAEIFGPTNRLGIFSWLGAPRRGPLPVRHAQAARLGPDPYSGIGLSAAAIPRTWRFMPSWSAWPWTRPRQAYRAIHRSPRPHRGRHRSCALGHAKRCRGQ